MKILITGANGMLGQDLALTLEKENYEVIKSDIDNLDITDETAVNKFIEDLKPDFIVHCAAYTNVDKAESDKAVAFKINGLGTENMAKAAKQADIPILYISTDYVFDGTNSLPYQTTDKPNPINVYGASKLKGEEVIQQICNKFYITRTSWLYGHKGKNFVETMINLGQKNPEIKVVNDQIGCPTSVNALSDMIVKIIKNNMPYGIYHTCGTNYTSWYGFACEIFKQMNMEVTVTPCLTSDFPRDAERPRYSVMDNKEFLPDWKQSLKEYIETRSN